ncbi:hypothetical protein OBV_24450 [Oscillibacter valericigenes Sjm18-20]|nr:hypothetical protein OBV_24450 [Oscillibacter valericigenes Sjm18-20]
MEVVTPVILPYGFVEFCRILKYNRVSAKNSVVLKNIFVRSAKKAGLSFHVPTFFIFLP